MIRAKRAASIVEIGSPHVSESYVQIEPHKNQRPMCKNVEVVAIQIEVVMNLEKKSGRKMARGVDEKYAI